MSDIPVVGRLIQPATAVSTSTSLIFASSWQKNAVVLVCGPQMGGIESARLIDIGLPRNDLCSPFNKLL